MESTKLCKEVTAICDMAMKRMYDFVPNKSTYWWSQDIADLRSSCIRAKRNYTRERRKRYKDKNCIDNKYKIYRKIKGELRIAIQKAKNKSWQELIDSTRIHGADPTRWS